MNQYIRNGWTSHGHAIPGMKQNTEVKPPVARCGGPKICTVCAKEVWWVNSRNKPGV